MCKVQKFEIPVSFHKNQEIANEKMNKSNLRKVGNAKKNKQAKKIQIPWETPQFPK